MKQPAVAAGAAAFAVAYVLHLAGLGAAAGPVVAAGVTLLAIGLNEWARYRSSTSELGYELDVECFDDGCKDGRISALVENRGRAIVGRAKAVVSVYVLQNDEKKEKKESLQGAIIPGDECKRLLGANVPYGAVLVNERNPRVVGEALPWALPETDTPYRVVLRVGERVYELPYAHITSISPSQRARLLIFQYKLPPKADRPLIAVFSEYGGEGPADVFRPRRACLGLDGNIGYLLEVTVYGEGARKPLTFRICVDLKKLEKISEKLERGTLEELKCK